VSNVTSNVTNGVEWLPARYPLQWVHCAKDVPAFDPLRQIYTRGETFNTYLEGSAFLGFSPYSALHKNVKVQWIQLKEAPKGGYAYPSLVRATPFDTREWKDKFFRNFPEEPVYKHLRGLFKAFKGELYPDLQSKKLLKQIETIANTFGLLDPYHAHNTPGRWLEAGVRCYCFVRIRAVLDKLVSDENEGERVRLRDLRDELCKSLELIPYDSKGEKGKSLPWLTQDMNVWWSRQAEDIASQVLRIFLEVKTVKKLRSKLKENLEGLFAAQVKGRLDYTRWGESYHFVARVGINAWLNKELAEMLYSSEKVKVCLYCGEDLELTPKTAKQNYCNDAHKQAAYRERRHATTV
jgi:hypothetical protein